MTTSTSNATKISWITFIKAVCMLFVYFSHSAIYYCGDILWIRHFYEPFYVNAFFVASGYLIFRKQLTSTVSARWSMLVGIFNKLVWPSVIFAAITYFPKMLLSLESLEWRTFFDKSLGGMTYWFVSALVVAEFILWIILHTKIRNVWFYYVVCLIISCFAIIAINRDWLFLKNYWMYKQALLCVNFLAFGGLFWKYERLIDRLVNKKSLIIMIIIYFGFVYSTKLPVHTTVSMCSVNFIGQAVASIACLLVIAICKFIPINNFIQFVGDNTICFYFFCGILPIVFSNLFHYLLPATTWVTFLVFLFSIGCACPIVWTIKKYMPFLFDFGLVVKKFDKYLYR